MNVKVIKIPDTKEEAVTIECYEINNKVNTIVRFIKSLQGTIQGQLENKEYEINIQDIYYIESVDNTTFIYTKSSVYTTRYKLYELEESLNSASFLRVSKSTIVNLMKIRNIAPAFNGRFSAVLMNGEQVIISRKYVPALKEKIRGGAR